MNAPAKVREEMPRVVRSISGKIRKASREIEGFNAKLALAITRSVGTKAYASIRPTQACRRLGAQLESRSVEEGRGWQAQSDAPTVGVHQRGTGPGDTVSLPTSPSLTSKRR